MNEPYTIDVIEVPSDLLERHGGRNWAELYAEAETDPVLLIRRTSYGNTLLAQSENPRWQPPRDRAGNEVAWLPLGKAWLREVDGRAFLYWQNW